MSASIAQRAPRGRIAKLEARVAELEEERREAKRYVGKTHGMTGGNGLLRLALRYSGEALAAAEQRAVAAENKAKRLNDADIQAFRWQQRAVEAEQDRVVLRNKVDMAELDRDVSRRRWREAERRAEEAEAHRAYLADTARKYANGETSLGALEAALDDAYDEVGGYVDAKRRAEAAEADRAGKMEVITALEQYVREVEADRDRLLARIAGLREVLEWLDRRGGLGHLAHDKIRKALSASPASDNKENPNGTSD